jgi:hypothetical protein
MKKLIVLLIVMVLMSSCLVMPTRLTVNERRLWIHQNQPKKYYFQKYPSLKQKTRRGKTYIPYFRLGKY